MINAKSQLLIKNSAGRAKRPLPVEPRINAGYIPIPESGCWLWIKSVDTKGYAQISVNGKNELAHRVSWVINKGDIFGDLCVLHKCDIPSCINPDHLFLGSHDENMKDMKKKGRVKFYSKLSIEKVKEIREEYSRGGVSTRVLAKKYGLSKSGVFNLVSNTRRKS